jgi:hypothetical protein
MSHTESKPAYVSPVAISLGKISDITLGSGEIETDFLGNTATYYGKWINKIADPAPDVPPTESSPE